MNTSNICKKHAPELHARTRGGLTELWIWECGSTDVSWACILSCLWKSCNCHPVTHYVETESSVFCCTVGAHPKARCQSWKTSVLAGKNWAEEAEFVWFSRCHICLPPICHYFLNHVIILIFLLPPDPGSNFLGFACIVCHLTYQRWKMLERKIWTSIWCPILDVKIITQ